MEGFGGAQCLEGEGWVCVWPWRVSVRGVWPWRVSVRGVWPWRVCVRGVWPWRVCVRGVWQWRVRDEVHGPWMVTSGLLWGLGIPFSWKHGLPIPCPWTVGLGGFWPLFSGGSGSGVRGLCPGFGDWGSLAPRWWGLGCRYGLGWVPQGWVGCHCPGWVGGANGVGLGCHWGWVGVPVGLGWGC